MILPRHTQLELVLGYIALFWVGFSLWKPKWLKNETPSEESWVGGIYYNPTDPALWVRSRNPNRGRYTLNYGNPGSWLVLAFFFIVFLGPLILVAFMGDRIGFS
jgi:hypothetical protein